MDKAEVERDVERMTVNPFCSFKYLRRSVETSLVANGYRPVSKAGKETAGVERSDYRLKTLVRTALARIRRKPRADKGTG